MPGRHSEPSPVPGKYFGVLHLKFSLILEYRFYWFNLIDVNFQKKKKIYIENILVGDYNHPSNPATLLIQVTIYVLSGRGTKQKI